MPNQTILIADDSPTEMSLAKAALEKKGYRILTAVDGEDALQVIQREHPSLVLLDIIMPKKNGYQVLREIKNNESTKATKVILISTKNQDSDRHWGLKQGADDYVCKPWEESALLSAVGRFS